MRYLEIENLNEYKDASMSFFIIPFVIIICITNYIITRSSCSLSTKLSAIIISVISLIIYTYFNFKDTKYFNKSILFRANIISLIILILHFTIWRFLYDLLSMNYVIFYFNSHSWLGIVIYSLAVISFLLAPILLVSIIFALQQDIKLKEVEKINSKNLINVSKLNQDISNFIFNIDPSTRSSFNVADRVCMDNLNFESIDSKKLYLNLDEKIEKINEFTEDFTCIIKNNLDSDLISVINDIDKISSNNIIGNTVLPSILKNHKTKLLEIRRYFDSRFNYINKEYSSAVIGLKGEKLVNSHIDIHKNIINLSNINLKSDSGQQIQCDNILITTKGIFILEVKNYGTSNNYSLCIDRDGRWLRKFGEELEPLSNAIEQNNRHVAILNEIINDSLGNTLDNFIDSKNVVVIANNTIDIYNNSSNQIVLRPSEIYPYLQSINKEIFTEEQINKIKDIIISHIVKPKKYPVYDVFSELDDNIIKIRLYVDKISNSLSLCNNLINNIK